jgi:galactose mutarotase-like enzyme
MSNAQYRHYACRITDDSIYKGMRVLFIENDLLRVGVLLDKGADIFQFLHKPSDTDFLWRSPQGLKRPDRFEATRASAAGAFLDSYHGGWQEILPGGGPVDYRGAELGLHGEVTHLGWEYEILEDTPECVSVKLLVECIRTPFRLTRTMTLRLGTPILFVDEELTNMSPETQDFMWGHHPAFGAPFLKNGLRLFIPAGRAQVHTPKFSASGILEPGLEFDWPVTSLGQGELDLSCVPGTDAGFAELLYLKDLSAGWYAILDPDKRIGIGLSWPKEIFPYLWFWLVYGKAPGYPWRDRTYCIALEPWPSIPNDLNQAIQQGTQAQLRGGETLKVSITASVITGMDTVNNIDISGTVS